MLSAPHGHAVTAESTISHHAAAPRADGQHQPKPDRIRARELLASVHAG
jgi:hypothetical protein